MLVILCTINLVLRILYCQLLLICINFFVHTYTHTRTCYDMSSLQFDRNLFPPLKSIIIIIMAMRRTACVKIRKEKKKDSDETAREARKRRAAGRVPSSHPYSRRASLLLNLLDWLPASRTGTFARNHSSLTNVGYSPRSSSPN